MTKKEKLQQLGVRVLQCPYSIIPDNLVLTIHNNDDMQEPCGRVCLHNTDTNDDIADVIKFQNGTYDFYNSYLINALKDCED